MASSADRFDSRDPASADEIDILFGTANPNPDRTGCPPPETLEALARHELPMDHPAYVHLAECSTLRASWRTLNCTSQAARWTG